MQTSELPIPMEYDKASGKWKVGIYHLDRAEMEQQAMAMAFLSEFEGELPDNATLGVYFKEDDEDGSPDLD